MSNKSQAFIEKIANPSVVIVGETERLRKNSVDFILTFPNIQHYVFLNPDAEVYDYVEKITGGIGLHSIKNWQEIKNIIDVDSFGVVAIGLNQIDVVFQKIFKKNMNKKYLFFSNIGVLKINWEQNLKNIEIIEHSFTQFAHENSKSSNNVTPIPFDKIYFENRGKEKDLHLNFLVNNDKRACKILGMEGIGKKSFLTELKTNYGLLTPNSRLFEIFFYSKMDSINDILIYLVNELGIQHAEFNLQEFKLDSSSSFRFIDRIFEKFDSIQNAKMIFYNIQYVYNLFDNKFINYQFTSFFNYLLKRRSYSGNKIYFISTVEFQLGTIDLQDFVETISLQAMKPYHIKLIISKHFGDKNLHDLAKKTLNLPEDLVNTLIGGHPQVAKLFVKACEYLNFESILNDEALREKFNLIYKIEYLIDKIDISNEETLVLEHLMLLKEGVGVTIDFINDLLDKPQATIEALVNKFFIEKSQKTRTEEVYEVPILIKSFLVSQLKKQLNQKEFEIKTRAYHTKLAYYFWSLAEKFETSQSKTEESYRLALYHYLEANDKDKLSLFILRFKHKFFDIAKRYMNQNRFKKAFELLNIIYNVDPVFPTRIFVMFLECETLVKKKAEDRKIIKEKYIKYFTEYEKDELMEASYVKFLFNNNELDEAEVLCENLVDVYPKNHKIRNTYPKIIFNLGRKEEAIIFVEQWINELKRMITHGNLNNSVEITNNYATLVNFYSSYQIGFKHICISLLNALKTSDKDSLIIKFCARTSYSEEIINLFYKKILPHQNCSKKVLEYSIAYAKSKMQPNLVNTFRKIFSEKFTFETDAEFEDNMTGGLNDEIVALSEFSKNIKSALRFSPQKNNDKPSYIIDQINSEKFKLDKILSLIDVSLGFNADDTQMLLLKAMKLIEYEYVVISEKIASEHLSEDTEPAIENRKNIHPTKKRLKKVFLSYSNLDEHIFIEFERHFNILKANNYCESWTNKEIQPGQEWKDEIITHIQQSDVIIFLVSANFISSDFCFNFELPLALKKHYEKTAILIPIVIKPCQWKETEFANIQVLPTNGKPIVDSSWGDIDYAYNDVIESLKLILKPQTA